jgi:hypothetical protein
MGGMIKMKNSKLIIFSSLAGFVLSFIFGLFSHSRFIRIFLTAVLFALIFALLAILISFVYSKFLDIDGNAPGIALAGNGSAKNSSNHTVDIVISESELEQTGNSNHFDVGNNKQMLNASDMSSVDETDTSAPESGFVPLRTKETSSNFSQNEALSPGAVKNSSGSGNSGVQTVISGTTLDELPDMGDVSFLQNNESDEGSIDLTENSDFISSALKYKDDNKNNIQDASLMAKAISSILSEET